MGARSAKVQADKPRRQQDAGKIYRILAMGNWSRSQLLTPKGMSL